METSENTESKKSGSFFIRISTDSTLAIALIPFAFSLIVFMFQVGRYSYYDIPLQYISITIGQLFTVWFGLFLTLGILGFAILDLLIKIFRKHRVFHLVVLQPLIFSICIYLILFIAEASIKTFYIGVAIFVLLLLVALIEPLFDKDKNKGYLDRIEQLALSKTKRGKSEGQANSKSSLNWDRISDNYYVVIFLLVILLGVPCRLGYLTESTPAWHWVADGDQPIILVDNQSDYFVLKEYDAKSKVLKSGYVIRPVSENTMKFTEVETGVLTRPVNPETKNLRK